MTETTDKADTDLVAKRRCVDEYLDNSRDEREWAEVHRDYFDDKQWSASEIAILESRGQPVITDNKIKDKVEYLEGVERKTRTDPKAFPRNPVDEESADVATDCIRYVFDKNSFPRIKSAVFQNLCIEGFGGCEVIADKNGDVIIRKIRWDRLYRDVYSMEPDCSDATFIGVITWMDESRALEKWPGSKSKLELTATQGSTRNSGESVDDKPRWADSKRKRVQIFEHYEKRKDKIYRSVFCWGGFLEEEEECPYTYDDDGTVKHEWPIIVASAYIDREGRRYGLVKRYISLQDEVNKRRSKSLHELVSKRVIAEKGAVENVATARKEVHKPDGYIETTPGMKFEVEQNLDMSAAHLQLLIQAENALSSTGPNAALLGQSGAISGRAKQLDQQGGSLQIGVLFDAIRDFQLRVARAVWSRIRQYWDSEMTIRVTDNENGFDFVSLNQPITQGDLVAQQMKGMPPEEIEPRLQELAQDPQAKLPAMDERGQPMKKNHVAQLDVDIILDEAPDVVTLQAEEFQNLTDLARSGTVQIPPEVLIEASNLRSEKKKRIMEILKPKDDPQAAMQQQFAEMMAKLDAMLKQAQVHKTEAEGDLAQARAQKEHITAATSVVEASSPPELSAMSGQPQQSGSPAALQ